MDDRRQRILRRVWVGAVAAVSVAAVAVVPTLAGPRAIGDPLLPDLDQAAPSNVGIEANGKKFDLTFDSAVDNVGDGPLIIHGSRASVSEPTMLATQRVQTEGGGTKDVPSAGSLRYVQSVGHSHWHLEGFDRYELRRVGSQDPARPDRKTGFCLGDRYEADVRLPNEGGAAFRGNCEPFRPNALTVDEGISVGWGDNYVAGLEGQAIDVTGLAAGRYLLIHRVNTDGLLKETSTANNAASVLVDLTWPNGTDSKPAVKVLGRCPSTDTCAASSAALPLGSPVEVASGLDTPWEVLPLPDGRVLVTERAGRVRVIAPGAGLRAAPAYADGGADKFLGMALDPEYSTDPDRRFVYLYVSYGQDENPNANRVVRLRDDGTNLVEPTTVFEAGIKSDGNHDGGRMAFGPDRKLYVTTGDVHDASLPQDLNSLNGKILRLEPDGSAPTDNPFPGPGPQQYVWSYGHRHPQGIGWDALGRMWETEHGPSGETYAQGERGRDEVNRIDRGGNYGWPLITGDEKADGMKSPVVHSGTDQTTTWAPGGLTFADDGRMYVPALFGQHLRSMGTSGDSVTDQRVLFPSTLGRLRTAVADGQALWLTTDSASNGRVLRVPFAPPPVPAGGAAPAGAGAGGASSPPSGSVAAAGQVTKQLDALLVRQARVLRKLTTARMARARPFRLRDRALPPKRLSLELVATRGGRRIARGFADTGTARATTVSMNFHRGARATVTRQRRRPPRMTLYARLRAPDGSLVTRVIHFTPKRAG